MIGRQRLVIGVTVAMAGALAVSAFAGDGAKDPAGVHGGRRGERRAMLRDRVKQAVRNRRQKFADFLASLNSTDEQRRVVLEQAKAAAPIVRSAHDEARGLIAKAWATAVKDTNTKDTAIDRKAARESVKEQLKALHERTKAQIEPLAKQVVATLTAEQKATIQAHAGKHGKTVDDAKLTKFAAHLITRPMTAAYLEARLAR